MPATPQINLVARDFDGIRRVLESYIKVKFPNEWRDFQSTGVATAILDVIAYSHAQRAYYYDRLSLNSFLVSADQIEAVKALTKALGYTMRPATSASVPVQLTPVVPQAAPVTIPKGTRLTVGDLVFEAADDLIIPAGRSVYPEASDNDVLSFVEGETIATSFTSDGSANQSFPVGRDGVIDGSLIVQVDGETWEEVDSLVIAEGSSFGRDMFIGDSSDSQVYQLTLLNVIADIDNEDKPAVIVNGVVWTQVDAFSGAPREYRVTVDTEGVTQIVFGLEGDDSAPINGDIIDVSYIIAGAQKRYEVVYDQDDEPTIYFGDGNDGVIPTNAATISVTFRVGGGVVGNIARNVINTVVNGQLPNGSTVAVRVRNREKGSGGEPPESIELAKARAPLFAKALNRAVTQQDFTVLAATFRHPNFGAPSHARARLSQRAPERNLVKVAVWSRDASGNLSTASSALKASMKKYLDSKRTITTYIEMEDGTVVYFDMDITVIVEDGYSAAEVFSAIRQEVTGFFNSANVMPGKDLAFSLLYERLQNLAGVESIVIKSVQGSVLQTTDIATGDGVTVSFPFDIIVPDGSEVAPFSIRITVGSSEAIDDGSGSFNGDIDNTVPADNNVDYESGRGNIVFATPPAFGATVSMEARTFFYAAFIDELDALAASTISVGEQTTFYPIRKRTPTGRASSTYARIANELRIGATNDYQGVLTPDIDTTTIQIDIPAIDANAINPDQVIRIVEGALSTLEGEAGTLFGGVFAPSTGSGLLTVGSINLLTGEVTFDITTIIADLDGFFGGAAYIAQSPLVVSYISKTIVIQMPEDTLPLTPGRMYFIGGKDPESTVVFGPPPAGHTGQLEAYDDGEGNIVGDVLSIGTINYDTGLIQFTWNTLPPTHGAPYPTTVLHFDPIGQPFDGASVIFDFIISESTIPQARSLDFSGGTDVNPPFVVGSIITQAVSGALARVIEVVSPNVYSVQPTNLVAFDFVNVVTGSMGGGAITAGVPSAGGTAQAWGTKLANMLGVALNASYAEGRVRLPLHTLSTNGVVFDDCFDNAFGRLDGLSLDSEGDNYIDYGTGKGRITFRYAPAATASPAVQTFEITNVVWALLAGFVWATKKPGLPGYDQYLYADQRGHLFGTPGSAYPASRLDQDVGKLVSDLSSSPPAGRIPTMNYDAALKSGADDVPIAGDQVSALGSLDIVEKEAETNL